MEAIKQHGWRSEKRMLPPGFDGWKVCSQEHISLITNSFFNDFAFIFQFQHKWYWNYWLYFISFSFMAGHFCMCVVWKKTLFSTLILGSVFNDYVIFYGDTLQPYALVLMPYKQHRRRQSNKKQDKLLLFSTLSIQSEEITFANSEWQKGVYKFRRVWQKTVITRHIQLQRWRVCQSDECKREQKPGTCATWSFSQWKYSSSEMVHLHQKEDNSPTVFK